MLNQPAILKTPVRKKDFLHSSRLACLSVLLLAQTNVWAEAKSADQPDDTTELDAFVITGATNEATVLEQSAAAVDVIDLKADQKLTADLSEVLAREPGISIRRMGGLGSRERFSLNGLENEQIRFFIDDIPLGFSGYTFGLGSIPVNLVSRVDVYHGVVPIKLGADALGGAINFITDKGSEGTGGAVSHMFGDFGTSRTTLKLNYVNDNGFFGRLNGFYDYSDNDYEVDVTLPNRLGKIEPYKAKRFHDAYEGKNVSLDFGFTEQSWAELFQVNVYSSEYFKEIQHNARMSIVYGEATVERETYGFNLRYKHNLTDTISVSATAGAAELDTYFVDLANSSYLWTGEEVPSNGLDQGEIGDACDCDVLRNSEYTTLHLDWKLAEGHTLGFAASPRWYRETSKNDFLTDIEIDAKRKMSSLVLGANYTLDYFDDKLQNQLFIKQYSQERESIQLNDRNELTGPLEAEIDRQGWGNQLRYKFNDSLLAKFSYEQATRLPNFNEVFGDSATIIPNLELEEEYSNNLNLSLEFDGHSNEYGSLKSSAHVFLRDIEDAIVLRRENNVSVYANVNSAESSGFMISGLWTSPEDFISIKASFNKLDLINTATEGYFAQFKDQRIPNRPHTFFHAKLGLKWLGIFKGYDEIALNWNYRFVDEFEIIWEQFGTGTEKPNVPSQQSHSLATTYTVDVFPYIFSVSAEVQNITDEQLFDHYGVQRPGRAFYLKTLVEF